MQLIRYLEKKNDELREECEQLYSRSDSWHLIN